MRIKIHREGWDILIISLLFLSALNAFLWVATPPIVFNVILIISVVTYLLLVNFFRCPKRIYSGETKNIIVAPADGKIVVVEEVFESEYLHTTCKMISIFMSPLNVHANWYPVNGKVKFVTHHEGNFRQAYLPKASTENERSTIVIETIGKQRLLVRQVAGALARRIVTYSDFGDKCQINEFLGFIKFGSRVDLYLPIDTEIYVKEGDSVTGNCTLIGRLSGVPAKKIRQNENN